ncbi:MAG: farnesyl diphosphate synthase [Rhodothermales bacterium]
MILRMKVLQNHSKQMIEAIEKIQVWAVRFERKLRESLQSMEGTPELLHDAMNYSVLAGGKRMRPMLVYAVCDALKIDYRKLDGVACAIEIIHAYSLIHDDLPAMDDDDLRRGRPTCHMHFDEATAILAGDALQALAFEILASDSQLAKNAETQVKIIREISRACGSSGMAGGQILDLSAVGREITHQDLSNMHRLKTGALIKVTATSVAQFAGANADLAFKLEEYGECVGLAFQIHDDILDVTGNKEKTGKFMQKDARQAKPTYPGILGLEASREQAIELRDRALSVLKSFPGDTSALVWLANFAIDRDN